MKLNMCLTGDFLLKLAIVVLSATIQQVSSLVNGQQSVLLHNATQQQQFTSGLPVPSAQVVANNEHLSSVEEFASKLITTVQFNKEINQPENLNNCETYLYHIDKLQSKRSVSDLGQMALFTKIFAAVYNDLLMQRYDSFSELRQSGGPDANQELCLQHLKHLNDRAEAMAREKYDSRDVKLALLLDTYGRVPAGLYLGYGYWPGAYEECQRLTIDTPDEQEQPTRYCVAHMRHKSWPKQNTPLGIMTALKSGVCLPKSCDSLNYKNKYQLVFNLIEFNARDIDRDQADMTDLYCLPDPESPLRTWWLQPAPSIAALCLSSWVLLLIYATYKHWKQQDGIKTAGTTGGSETSAGKFFASLSITNNLRLLFDTSKASSLMDTGKKLKGEESSTTAQVEAKGAGGEEKSSFVDLRVLEGIKVVAMGYVILGHVLMCMAHVIKNGRDTADTTSPFFFLANLAPAFAVNSFFTITGLLTSYLIFKQNQSFSFISSPIKWLAFIAYRYARIMPMYILVVAYAKYLAKFTGSGPFWDYGTSTLAHRRTCEEESWLWTVLFAANFKSPLSHCIPSAWYLANDFQFFLVTPVFLSLLHARPRLGQALIYTCIALGCMAGFTSVYNADLDDLRPIARFMPHGFKTYVTHLHANYTRPQNRIPAYLCGLLVGYYLFVYERDRLKFNADKRAKQQQQQQNQKEEDSSTTELSTSKEPDWPEVLLKYGLAMSVFIVIGCVATPVIGTLLPFNKSTARIAVALVMPSYHLLFSFSVGLYILLATTGHGNRHLNALLSSNLWKPLARLSLCVVLVNVEVIIYLTQIRSRVIFMDTMSHMTLNIVSIIASYLTAIVMCVLFEAPIRSALSHLLSAAVAKVARRKNRDNKKEV